MISYNFIPELQPLSGYVTRKWFLLYRLEYWDLCTQCILFSHYFFLSHPPSPLITFSEIFIDFRALALIIYFIVCIFALLAENFFRKSLLNIFLKSNMKSSVMKMPVTMRHSIFLSFTEIFLFSFHTNSITYTSHLIRILKLSR